MAPTAYGHTFANSGAVVAAAALEFVAVAAALLKEQLGQDPYEVCSCQCILEA